MSKIFGPLRNETARENLKIIATIPCYNTQNHIAEVVVKTKRYVDEVIVIDDGSTDMTTNVARSAGAKVISHEINLGYGEAIKSCFAVTQAEKADIVVTIDGDGQHDPDEIPNVLLPILVKEADLVIGSRFLAVGKKMPRYRKFGIRIINYIWNLGSKIKVSDTQSGFRAYDIKSIKDIHFSEKGMGISIEILENARRKGIIIKEVPITCSYENNNSYLGQKALMHGFKVVLSVIKIRLRSIIMGKKM
jgi:glycosyltransferase involved in cell wall biosynthesis